MSAARKICILGLLALVVLGHLLCIFTFRDVWPFSRYAMYAGSAPVPRPLVIYRAYGVTADASPAEFELGNGPLPLSDTVLRARWEKEWADPKRTSASLLAAGQWYERLRARDEHSSAGGARPRLAAVRLYRLEWDVLPDASNRAQPTRRVLLNETPMNERA